MVSPSAPRAALESAGHVALPFAGMSPSPVLRAVSRHAGRRCLAALRIWTEARPGLQPQGSRQGSILPTLLLRLRCAVGSAGYPAVRLFAVNVISYERNNSLIN